MRADRTLCTDGPSIRCQQCREPTQRGRLLPDAEFAVFQVTDARTSSVLGWTSILLD